MKTNYLFLFLLYLLPYQSTYCQQSVSDSLEKLLIQTTITKDKVTLCQALIVEYKEKNPDKVVQYSNQILNLLTQDADEKRGEMYNYIGIAYRNLAQYNKAISHFDSAMYYFQQLGLEKRKKAVLDNKGFTYQRLVVSNLYKDPDKAMGYAQLLLKLAPENKNNLGNTYGLIGAIHGIKHQTKQSLQFLDSAVYYLKETGNQKDLARMYNHIGGTHHLNLHYKEASEWFYKSLAIYDSLDMPARTASTLDGLAAIDIYLKDYPEAIKKTSRALELYTNANNARGIAVLTFNMGVVYIHAKEWKNAILYFNKAIPLLIEQKFFGNLMRAYSLKADALEKNGQLKLAQQSIQKAIALKEHSYNQVDLLALYVHQAKLLFATKDYAQSISFFTTVLDSSKQTPHLLLQRGAIQGLIDNYIATNDFKQAYVYASQLRIVSDSLIAQNNQKNIKDIEIKYNTNKKEQENQLLIKEKALQAKDAIRNRQLLYFSISIAILILLLSILILRQYKLTAAATNNQLKSKLLRNQMSPHFLFNSLVAIQSFVYTNKPIKAGDYLSSFASLMRAILDNSSQEYITIEKELQWLENYLSLQLLRFSHKFEYRIDLDETIQVHDALIPPMLIQPFIENALEHGLKDLDKKGLLFIRIQQVGEELLIEVEDNGLGISTTKSTAYKKHQSRALTITQKRLKFLNKKQTKKIDFDIKSSPNNGTLVSFKIPFKSNF